MAVSYTHLVDLLRKYILQLLNSKNENIIVLDVQSQGNNYENEKNVLEFDR